MITVDYEELVIRWGFWDILPKLDQLIYEMSNNNFEWCNTKWDTYIKKYYNLNISVCHSFGCIEFENMQDMQLFVLHFM